MLENSLKLKKEDMISKLKFLPDLFVAFGFLLGIGSGSLTTIASNITLKLDSNTPFCDTSTKCAAIFPNSWTYNIPEKREKSPHNLLYTFTGLGKDFEAERKIQV